MKWIKGLLVLGMITFTYSTISINEIEARGSQTHEAGAKSSKKAKAPKGSKVAKGKKDKNSNKSSKKGGFFASIKGAFASVGSKLSNSVNCRAGKGQVSGEALYSMAKSGEKLTDAHVVTAHASPKSASGASGRKKGRS